MQPAVFQARFRAAIGHLNAGDVAAATAEHAALRRAAPDDPAVLQLGATIALRDGRPQEAADAAARSLAARPGHAPTLIVAARAALALGWALQRGGQPEAARDALQRAVAAEPGHAGAWFALGLACQDLGNEAAASRAYQSALTARPDMAEAAVNLGIALQRLGDMKGAMRAYRTAIAVRPDTLGRIAQAMTAAGTGVLWLDPAGLRDALSA